MKFINPFRSKKKIDKESILKLVDKDTVYVNYINKNGDEEGCLFNEWFLSKRGTNKLNDITRYYLYDGSDLKYIIRIKSNILVCCVDEVKLVIDSEFIQQITDKLL
jgi:hypothetical protein